MDRGCVGAVAAVAVVAVVRVSVGSAGWLAGTTAVSLPFALLFQSFRSHTVGPTDILSGCCVRQRLVTGGDMISWKIHGDAANGSSTSLTSSCT